MTSMSPAAEVTVDTTLSLLAGAIFGAAGKAPTGLDFGHLQKVGEGYGTPGVKVTTRFLMRRT